PFVDDKGDGSVSGKLVAVPKLSCVVYRAIIKPKAVSSKPSTLPKMPSAAITAPPGTPGAAIITTPSNKMNCNIIPKDGIAIPFVNMTTAMAQVVNVMVLPDKWMVAHKGTAESDIPSLTSFFFDCLTVTGIVAALDMVPKPVK